MAAWRAILVLAALPALGGCGVISPSEGQMQGAILRNLAKAYNPGAQIEYFEKIDCSRKWGKGFFCHFQMTANIRRVQFNQGLFFYHHGWQVKDFSLNPNTPS